MTTEINDEERITPRLAQGLEAARLGAQRVIAEALARLPEVHRLQIQRAVDSGQCALTLQIDLPSYDVRVMADGEGWLKPQCLFVLKRDEQPELPRAS